MGKSCPFPDEAYLLIISLSPGGEGTPCTVMVQGKGEGDHMKFPLTPFFQRGKSPPSPPFIKGGIRGDYKEAVEDAYSKKKSILFSLLQLFIPLHWREGIKERG
jgi:hypothetical protein